VVLAAWLGDCLFRGESGDKENVVAGDSGPVCDDFAFQPKKEVKPDGDFLLVWLPWVSSS